jgi:hypothetical protein
MREGDRPGTSYAAHPIWVRLDAYSIGPADAALGFADRLARENGWSRAKADRVIGEYKRFCFLAATLGQEVTPSDAVDQAWHLHLAYTRDYWERFCPEVLGRPLHHGPTTGGAAQRHAYFETYAQTLRSYEAVFGEPPPADLWPGAARRLIDDPKARRVHPREAFIVPRRIGHLLLGLAILILVLQIASWRS